MLGVRDDSVRGSSRLVPHSTVRVDRQVQGVHLHFHKGVLLTERPKSMQITCSTCAKKPDKSLRDYLKRFKAKKANIIGCNDLVASSAFKKGLRTKHELYRELAITTSLAISLCKGRVLHTLG